MRKVIVSNLMSLDGFMAGPNGNMMIFGSGTLVSAQAPPGLIDEYRIVVNPVVLGSGKPLFREIREKIDLQLLKTRTLACRDVILYYRPGAKG